jgi:hypothetical protein
MRLESAMSTLTTSEVAADNTLIKQVSQAIAETINAIVGG